MKTRNPCRRAGALAAKVSLLVAGAGAFAQSAAPPGPPMGLFDHLVLTNCVHVAHQHQSFHAPLWPYDAPTPVFPGKATLKARTISGPDLANFISDQPSIIPSRMGVQLIGQIGGLGYQWTDSFIEIKEPAAPQIVHLKGRGSYVYELMNDLSDVVHALAGHVKKGIQLKAYPREELKSVTLAPNKTVYQPGDTIQVAAEFAYPLPSELPHLFTASIQEVSLVRAAGNVALAYPAGQTPIGPMTLQPSSRKRARSFTLSLPPGPYTSQAALTSQVMQNVHLDIKVRATHSSSTCDLLKGETEKTVRIAVANPYYAPAQMVPLAPKHPTVVTPPTSDVERNKK